MGEVFFRVRGGRHVDEICKRLIKRVADAGLDSAQVRLEFGVAWWVSRAADTSGLCHWFR